MIEVNPVRKKSIIFSRKDFDNIHPLDDILSKYNSGRQQQETSNDPQRTRPRIGSVNRYPSLVANQYGSLTNMANLNRQPSRQPSEIIKPPSYQDPPHKTSSSTDSLKHKHNISRYLNEYDDGNDSDHSKSEEEDKKWGRLKDLKSLIGPKKHSSELVIPLDIVKDDIVRQAQYSGKEYKIKARPRSYLLSIIALQAVGGPFPQVSKIFEAALAKVNPDMLVWAKYAQAKKKKSKIRKFWDKVKQGILRPFSPESSFIMSLDILLFFTILYQAFFSTYLVTFVPNGDMTYDNPFLIADFVADLFYIFKMLITFHTGFYYLGEINYKHKDIAMNYLKGTFIIDAISLLDIIGYFFINSNMKAFQVFCVLRLYRIPDEIRVFEDYFLVSREISYVIRVLKLALVLFIYGHFLGCALYGLAYTNFDDPTNWFISNGFEGQDSGDAYVTSLYFALETASTLGFGEITPGNTRERIFFVPQMIASAILFGYVISVIARILAEMSMFSFEARERIRLLKKYMKDKGVQKSTQNKIIKYSRFFLSRENLSKVKDDGMVQFLSESLRDDLIREINVKILSQCQMFTYNFRTKFLLSVSRALIERAFGPDEIIFRYRDKDDLSVYFMISGKVEAYYARLGLSLGVLEKRGAFGFVSFFNGKSRPNDQRSLEFTTVFQLKQEVFLEKLKEFPSERETYYLMRDSMVMYNDYKFLVNVHCILCGEKNHIALVCPTYHWYPDKEKVVQTYLQREKRAARNFKRKNRPKISALGRLNHVKNAALKIQNIESSQLFTRYRKKIRDEDDFYSYSPTNDIFDRNLFRIPSFTFHADSQPPKKLAINENTGINSADAQNIFDCLETKPRMGELERFVIKNYDAYYRNLNIDRVRNYEMYFPHNNIFMISAQWELVRQRNIARIHNVSEKALKGLAAFIEKNKLNRRNSSGLNRSFNNIPPPSLFDDENGGGGSPLPKIKKEKSIKESQFAPKKEPSSDVIINKQNVNVSHSSSHEDEKDEKEAPVPVLKSPRKSVFHSMKSHTVQPQQPTLVKRGLLLKHSSSLRKESNQQQQQSVPGDSIIEIGESGEPASEVSATKKEKKLPFVDNYKQSRLIDQPIEAVEERRSESVRSEAPLRMRRKVDNSLMIHTGRESAEESEEDDDIEKSIEELKLAMKSEFEGLMDKMTKTLIEKKKRKGRRQSKRSEIPEMKIEREIRENDSEGSNRNDEENKLLGGRQNSKK